MPKTGNPSFYCRFCNAAAVPTEDVCVDMPVLKVLRCEACGLVQVGDISHVSDDFYASNSYFPDDFAANLEREERWNLKRIARLRTMLPDAEGRRVLDFGCGVGGFLRRAQNTFAAVVGFDLSSKVCRAHCDLGFSCVNRLDGVPADIDTIVMFHVLEHVVRPWELLAQLSRRFPGVDRIVIEVPNTDEALKSLFFNTAYRNNHYSSEHIYYFNNMTLRRIVERAGLEVLIDTQLQRYTLGNNLGWLANDRGGGQSLWPPFNEASLDEAYEQALIKLGAADSVFMVCTRP